MNEDVRHPFFHQWARGLKKQLPNVPDETEGNWLKKSQTVLSY